MLSFQTKNKFSLFLAGAIFVVLALTGFFIGRETRHVLGYVPTQGREDQRADCAVVLTGGMGRLREGFSLLEQGQIKKLIVSGVHPQATLREVFPLLPFYGSIDEKDVILERRSTTTYGNVVQSLPFIEALRCRSLLVVTSPLHLHRSLRTFKSHLPEDFPVEGRAINVWPGPNYLDIGLEIFKSCFYALWAY